MRRIGAVAASLLLVGTLAPAARADTSPSADYTRGYRIGQQAYAYGLPLLTTNRTFLTMTSTDVSQGAYGPVNQFNSVRAANTSASSAVVAPGASSLSSIAWLDLTAGPQVLHVPKVTDRSFVLAFLDPYTTNLVNLGSASKTPPGDYVVRWGAQQRSVPLPIGTHALDVDYSRIWIIGSTQLKGPGDVAAANAVQDGYTLTPLGDFEAGTTPTAPAPTQPTITTYSLPTGLAFFDTLGQLLQLFPPPARDAAALRTFATVGIGPGMTPSQDPSLSADTLQGLTDAVAAGPTLVAKATKGFLLAGYGRHNGYLLGGFGRYGTDYLLRAVVSQVGLGAFTSDQAIYAMTWVDDTKAVLDGSRRYVLHLATPPPVREAWSLTAYDLQGGLMANPIDRYAFTNTSLLTRNADGSVDIYVQADAPATASQRRNWLPVAAGTRFELMWRLIAPKPKAVPSILSGSGWQPPAVTRVNRPRA